MTKNHSNNKNYRKNRVCISNNHNNKIIKI